MSKMEIRKAADFLGYARCIQVRTKVFVIGQNVPPEREIDEFENECIHFLVLHEGKAAGAGRWRRGSAGEAKIERVAVLDEYRGHGIGKKLMRHIMEDIQSAPDIKKIKLGSQDHAIPFYEALGFSVYGEGYDDGGGIPHHDMVKKIA